MKYLFVFAASICVGLAAPPPSSVPSNKPPPVEIVSLDSEVLPDGSFRYSYEGSDGTKASQEGFLKYVDEKNAGEAVKGSYQYIGDDGKLYLVTYTADENGFRAEGEHIPTIPPVIVKALEFNKEHPSSEEPQTKSS